MNDGCEFLGDAVTDLALGRLEAHRRATVEAHLAGCAECRHRLQVTREVARARAPVPEGLEARLQAAVRDAVGDLGEGRKAAGPGVSLRRWAPHLAAAAVLAALWIGVASNGEPDPAGVAAGEVAVEEEYAPYGAWPASGEVVAGELVLSELSLEELESLLEELES